MDADQANEGIAAYHIAQGIEFPLFAYGVVYQGTIEEYVSAAFVRVLGMAPWVIRLSPTVFSLAALAALWTLFQAAGLGRQTLWMPWLVLVGPPFFIRWSTLAEASYPETLFLGTCLFLLYFTARKHSRSSPGVWLLGGLIVGLGLWTWYEFILFPAALGLAGLPFFLRNRPASVNPLASRLLVGLAGVLIGGLPLWFRMAGLIEVPVENWSFQAGVTTLGRAAVQAKMLLLAGFPMLFGLSWPAATFASGRTDLIDMFLGPPPEGFARVLYAGLGLAPFLVFSGSIALAVVLVWRHRSRIGIDEAIDLRLLLLVFLAINSVAFAIHQNSHHEIHWLRHVRYLYVSYVALFGLGMMGLAELWERRRHMATALGIACLVFFSWGYVGYTERAFASRLDHPELIQALIDAGVRGWYASSMSEAFELTYESGERLVFTPLEGPDGHAGHRNFVDSQSLVAYVFHGGESALTRWEQQEQHVNWTRIENGSHRIFVGRREIEARTGRSNHP